ncbi:hypothetical protein T492DRAFT_896353 [Pavlovales sp. CCMP2436]|nr:hypothetical protein T492DRAFT_896353 [Pavlovales sp. CCMP2436]
MRLVTALLSMPLDLIQPVLYKLEKRVASASIPQAFNAPGRLRLANEQPGVAAGFDHSAWTGCLQRHVTVGGAVGDFDRYLVQLEGADLGVLGPREELVRKY